MVRAIAWLPFLAALVAAAAWLLTAGPLKGAEWLLRPMLVAASIASALALVVLVVDALRGWLDAPATGIPCASWCSFPAASRAERQ